MRPSLRLFALLAVMVTLGVGAEVGAQGQNHSPLAEAGARPPAPALRRLVDAGVEVTVHKALGQPTLLRIGPGWVAAATTNKPVPAARQVLRELGPIYGLTDNLIDGLDGRVAHDTGFGGIIVTFRQAVGGIEVFERRLNVVLERATLAPVALTGFLAPGYGSGAAPGRLDFTLPARIAVQTAIVDRHGVGVDPAAIRPAGDPKGPYSHFELSPTATATIGPDASVEPVRIKPVYFDMPDGLRPAYYLELVSSDSAAPRSTWGYVVSATDGRILSRMSLDFTFEYRVWADPVDGWPLDSPLGTALSPLPPDAGPELVTQFVDPILYDVPTGLNAPGDPWLPEGATDTSGNNVDAYADLNAPDGFTQGSDLRAEVTAPGIFGLTYDPLAPPDAPPTQRPASIQHHFYVVNYLHDVFYDRGFDEASGTAQVDNYGRGGLDGDPLKAESHDFGGTNNANMSTPADGASPRMQTYLWTTGGSANVTAGSLDPVAQVGVAAWGPTGFDVTAPSVVVDDGANPDSDGCSAVQNDVTGKVALIDRGNCNFVIKVLAAQDAGAVGVIIMNDRPGGTTTLGGTPPRPITIPTLMVTQDTGAVLRGEQLGADTRLRRTTPPPRPSALDTTIIAHEWGHYLFGRLAPGQGTLQSGGLNEGTADFVALLMMVRAEDTDVPGNEDWQGSYPALGYSDLDYQGIRRVVYSTDPAVNGLTLAHIANGAAVGDGFFFRDNGQPNSEVHNTGEVWATALWEVFVGLLRQHEFAEARRRMMEYLVAGLKLTPPSATFVELRDAITTAIAAADTDDVRIAWQAFARRGLGTGAVAPARNSSDNTGVTESFELRKDLAVVDVRLTDGLQSCDNDGVLDPGELGMIQVEIVGGAIDIDDAVVTVTADPVVSFPFGDAINAQVLPPGGRAVVDVPVRLDAFADVTSVAFTVTVTAADLVDPPERTVAFAARVNHDELAGISRADDVEAAQTVWTVEYDQALTRPTAFTREEVSLDDHRWTAIDFAGGRSDQYLVSPPLEVSDGAFVVQFDHRFRFESTGDPLVHYDAAVLEINDGEGWQDVGQLVDIGYNGQVTDLGGNNRNPLYDRQAWVDRNPSHPAFDHVTADLGTRFAGGTVQLRFRIATDPAVGNEGWALDNFAFEGIDNTPFPGRFANQTTCPSSPPIADAGVDRALPEGQVATLSGAASNDPWDRPLSWAWAQRSGPEVTLVAADTASATFTAPDVRADTALVFALVVATDDDRTSTPDEVTVVVQRVNNPPVADAGDDAAVDEGRLHTLDGSGSSDEDEDPLTYAWTQTRGPHVALSDGATPTFQAPQVAEDTVLRFGLQVSDGFTQSEPDTVEITVIQVNLPPLADAGPDQTAAPLSTVTLDGTGSSDPDGDALSFAWAQTDGPGVEFDATASRPTFEAPYVHEQTDLTFSLVVNDGALDSAPAEVVVTVLAGNIAPTADAGPDGAVDERAAYTLAGTGQDEDGDALTWLWTQVSGPETTLSARDEATPSFTAPEVAVDSLVVFDLVVADGTDTSEPDTVEILVRQVNRPPVADAGADAVVAPLDAVTLDGSASTDPDSDEINYTWTQVDGPEVALDSDVAQPEFEAPYVHTETGLTFELVVSDGELSDTARVTVTVSAGNLPPIADAGDDAEIDGGVEHTLDGTASTDPDGDPLSFLWVQLAGPDVPLDAADTATPSFTALALDEDATLVFGLVVNDGGLDSDLDAVEIRVLAPNRAPVADAGRRAEVDEGAIFRLDGSASADADGDPLTFRWTQIEGVPGIFNADDVTVDVAGPAVTQDSTLRFQLVVSDGRALSDPATVDVLVRNLNAAPIADAGPDQTVDDGAVVQLDASGSRDPDGGTLEFAWTQIDGEPVAIDGANRSQPTFVAAATSDEETILRFEVLVIDTQGVSAKDQVTVTVVRAAGPSVTGRSSGGCSTPPGQPGGFALALVLLGLLAIRR